MSTGSWLRDQRTGIKASLLDRCDKKLIGSDGNVDVSLWPDSDMFDVTSFAAAAGFSDTRYFVTYVLNHPQTPFHCHKVFLTDAISGGKLATLYATHQDSAVAGGEMWRETKTAEARARVLPASQQTVVNSLQQF